MRFLHVNLEKDYAYKRAEILIGGGKNSFLFTFVIIK